MQLNAATHTSATRCQMHAVWTMSVLVRQNKKEKQKSWNLLYAPRVSSYLHYDAGIIFLPITTTIKTDQFLI